MKQVKVSLLVMLFVFSASSVTWAEWSGASADQYISSFTPGNKKVYATEMAAGPNGELYAIWAQKITTFVNEIYFSRSLDGGVTWSGTSGDQMISTNDGDGIYTGGIYNARRTEITVDSQGRIYVFWPENYIQADFDTTVEVMMVMSTDGGDTWINSMLDFPVSDTNSSEIANSPAAAIDLNDNIHVVWNQKTPADTAEIHYSVSTDNGATWSGRSADRYISYPSGTSAIYPNIAIGPDNSIHVVWREYHSSSDCRLYYGVSTDGGTTFSSETSDSIISTATYSIKFPRITVSSLGYIHIIYAYNDTAVYVGTTDGGNTWNETMVWAGSGYDMSAPDIAVTSSGDLVAILDEGYPDPDMSQIHALYSYDNGLAWTVALDPVSNFNPSEVFDRCYIPSIAVTEGDTLHVVYHTNYPPESGNSYQEVCYSRGDTLAGEEPGCDYVPGDANGDSNVMGNDVTYSVRYFKGLGAPPPDSCWNAEEEEWLYSGGDANGNCAYTGSDVTFLVAYFKGYNPEILWCPQTPPAGFGILSLEVGNRPGEQPAVLRQGKLE